MKKRLMIKKVTSYMLLLLAFVLLTACSVLSPVQTASISSYKLTTNQETSSSQSSRTKYTLLVSAPIAEPGYQTSAMIYTAKPYELRSFAYNRWVSPPSEMILSVLTNQIEAAHYFKAVISPPFSGKTDYRLLTELLVFQQEFLESVSNFQIQLKATLIDNRTQRIIVSQVFEEIVPAFSNDPYGGVLAANKAVNNVSDEITQFAIKNIKRDRSS